MKIKNYNKSTTYNTWLDMVEVGAYLYVEKW